MNKIDNYVNEVLDNIIAEEDMKKRIKSDLYSHLYEVSQGENIDNIIKKMGDPKEVAKEFMESIYEDKTELIDKLIQERIKVKRLLNYSYEYRSKTTLLGLPLVHVKFNRRGRKPCMAKGIIAIGTISVGVISIGAIPLGIISIGGAALGVVSLGGLAIGLLLSMGGLSLGGLALGGVAVGFGAIGGLAIGKIAVGGYARGTVAIGATAVGKYTMITHHIGLETREAVTHLIRMAYPNLPGWIMKIFTSLKMSIGQQIR